MARNPGTGTRRRLPLQTHEDSHPCALSQDPPLLWIQNQEEAYREIGVVPQFQFSILIVGETGLWLGLTIGRQEFTQDGMGRERES
jgi:hypothetical protein